MPGIKGICCAHRFCSHSLRLIGFVLFCCCCCCGTWSIASGCGCGRGRGMMRMISDICIVHECVCYARPRVVVCGLGGTAWQSALLCSLAANYLSTCRAPAASQITLIDCARAGVCACVNVCVHLVLLHRNCNCSFHAARATRAGEFFKRSARN